MLICITTFFLVSVMQVRLYSASMPSHIAAPDENIAIGKVRIIQELLRKSLLKFISPNPIRPGKRVMAKRNDVELKRPPLLQQVEALAGHRHVPCVRMKLKRHQRYLVA